MDIAKYIGLYLLKNNYSYIPGLGNLEMKKRPASHDGTTLTGPAYEVIVTPGGSIDDSLANFIATNEQISISKASNGIREFSTTARQELQAGKEVVIPALGKFVETGGKIQFITDPHIQYTPRAIPTVKHVAHTQERQAEQKAIYSNPNITKKEVNWLKISLFVLIPVILIVAVVLGMNYMNSQPEETVVEEPVVEQPVVAAPPPVDTTTVVDTMAAPASNVAAANGILNFKLIIREGSKSSVERRAKQLQGMGKTVEVVMKDSATWYVVLPVSAAIADTAHVIDSIRLTLNPKGVRVYQ
jgi:nucleoid DNA-binding protein